MALNGKRLPLLQLEIKAIEIAMFADFTMPSRTLVAHGV